MHFLTGSLTCHILHSTSCIACHWSQYFLILNVNTKCVGSWKINPFYTVKFNQISWFFWTIHTKSFIRIEISWNVIHHCRHPLHVEVHRCWKWWKDDSFVIVGHCLVVTSQFSMFLLITSLLLFLLSILKLIVLLQKHLCPLWSLPFTFKFTIDHCVALEKILYAC